MQSTFDGCIQVQFGAFPSFGEFPMFDDIVSRKRLVVERNEPRLGPQVKYLGYTEYIWLLSVRVQFRVIRCISDDLVSWKTPSHRTKWTKLWASGVGV